MRSHLKIKPSHQPTVWQEPVNSTGGALGIEHCNSEGRRGPHRGDCHRLPFNSGADALGPALHQRPHGRRGRTVWKSQKYIKTAVTFPQCLSQPRVCCPPPTKEKDHQSGQGNGGALAAGQDLGGSLQPGNGRRLTVFTGSTPPSTRGPLGGQRCRRVRQDAADGRALPQGQKTEEK